MKTDFPDKWNYLDRNLSYPYEFFNSVEDYQKPVTTLKKDFSGKLMNAHPSVEEIERTKGIILIFIRQKGKKN